MSYRLWEERARVLFWSPETLGCSEKPGPDDKHANSQTVQSLQREGFHPGYLIPPCPNVAVLAGEALKQIQRIVGIAPRTTGVLALHKAAVGVIRIFCCLTACHALHELVGCVVGHGRLDTVAAFIFVVCFFTIHGHLRRGYRCRNLPAG